VRGASGGAGRSRGLGAALAWIGQSRVKAVECVRCVPAFRDRRNTARCTDERVRLTGEVVEGILAAKMLAWEAPFTSALAAIRQRETSFSRRMARIRAVNFALQFAITPIVSFVTFGVYRARNGTLSVSSVFYALSLLHLPKLYMVRGPN
jgi:hypothetical protein